MTPGPAPDRLRASLLDHFDRTKRPLPWRSQRTGYRVLVSEFMLQQTRVETVLPYYSRWLDRFPDFDALANATLDDVLRAWQGLGYYSRARNLHRAALVVRERFGGRLPRDPEVLRELPGVGEYTAGAVASIAFGVQVPAVDGNVKRVLSRLYDLESPSAKALRELAAALVDPERPGDFNEALMDLGATVCTPRGPDCPTCPLETWCGARAAGTVSLRPPVSRGRPPPVSEVSVAVVVDGEGRILVGRRPDEGLLAGMWEFPPVDELGALDVSTRELASLAPVKHVFTHRIVTYLPAVHSLVDAFPGAGAQPGSGGRDGAARPTRWLAFGDLGEVALPVAQQRIAAAAEEWLTTGT